MEIYLDESIRNFGYSCGMIFKTPLVYVSVGKTNSGAAPHRRVIMIESFGVTVMDTNGIDVFERLETSEEKEQHAMLKVISALTPEILVKLLSDEKRGIAAGKAMMQGDIRKVLGLR